MATISNTPRPGYIWDSTDNVWYPIGTGTHSHANIPNTIVTAKGDILAATGNSTITNVAIGTGSTSGGGRPQALVPDSTQTSGVRWGDDYQILDVMQAI